MAEFIDLTGKKFGRLTVLLSTGENRRGHAVWMCKCDCGKIIEVRSDYLRKGDTKSCGCLQREKASKRCKNQKTHGGTHERLYKVWKGMKQRCNDTNDPHYQRYGLRGIFVCQEWADSYQAFKEWAYSHGYDDSAPKGVCTIDRINNDKGYSPDNCRFVSTAVQNKNTSKTRNITVLGETKCLKEWAKVLQVDSYAIYRAERLYGVPPESYIRYRLDHIGERRVRISAVMDASEKWGCG